MSLSTARLHHIRAQLKMEREHTIQFHRLLEDVAYQRTHDLERWEELMKLVKELEKDCPYLRGERKMYYRKSRTVTEEQPAYLTYTNEYSPEDFMPLSPPQKRRRIN